MRRLEPGSRAAVLTALLAAVLGAGAPLVHAHLDAAGASASGLCGEHDDTGADPEGPCSLCLGGSGARAALHPSPKPLPAPDQKVSAARTPEAKPGSALGCAPGDPRAPPSVV